jgi:hypothetical protein
MQTIEYLPALETQPPIDVLGSGNHYKLTVQQPISRAYFGQRLGDVRVQTAEPKPLEYTNSVASTTCYFNVNFISTRRKVQQCPIEDGPLQMYQDTINLGKS